MLLSLLVLAVTLYSGLAFGRRFFAEHQLAFAVPTGIAFSTWSTAIVSYAIGFSEISILLGQVLLFAVVLALDGKPRLEMSARKLVGSRGTALLALVALASFGFFNYSIFHFDSEGGVRGIPSDLGFHLAQATTIAKGGDFPPHYPVLGNEPLSYYYFVNLYTASLIKGGLPLEPSVWLPLSFLGASLVVLLYLLGVFAFKSRLAAVLGVLLVLFNGSFAFLPYFEQNKIDTVQELISALPNPVFLIGGYLETGYPMTNFLVAFVLLQRAVVAGLPILLAALLLMFQNKQPTRKHYLALGLLLGLLPLFHIFLFLLGFGALLLYALIYERKKEWAEGLGLAFVLALPQLVYYLSKVSGGASMLSLNLGWMSLDSSPWGIAIFWLANLGPHIVLAAIGWKLANKTFRRIYLCSLPAFVAINLVGFTPWPWDNVKLLLVLLPLTGLLAGGGLARLLRGAWHWKAIGVALAFLALFTGVLSLLTLLNAANTPVYSPVSLEGCAWVEQHTDPAKLFLTNGGHSCLFATAGRRIFLGDEEWVRNHGFPFDKLLEENNRMLQGNCTLLQKNNIGYYFEGDILGRQAQVNRTFLETSGTKLFENREVTVYEIKC